MVANERPSASAPHIQDMKTPRSTQKECPTIQTDRKMTCPRPFIASPAVLSFPNPTFTHALHDDHNDTIHTNDRRRRQRRPSTRRRTLPQCVAHRGFNRKYPENTMAAFKAAVRAGAHAIETDIHITRDNVVVLSHDPTLKRCFGVPGRIADYDWEDLKKLNTVREPQQRMCRFSELLEWLADDEDEEDEGDEYTSDTPRRTNRRKSDVWLFLDIKLTSAPEPTMHALATTILSAPPSTSSPWQERILLGIWSTSHLPLCATYLPSFPISYIGFSLLHAMAFLRVPHVSFSLLKDVLVGPLATLFLRRARQLHRDCFAWTVNKENWMRWCIERGLDGVVTDDPELYLEVCRRWREEEDTDELEFSSRELQTIEGDNAAATAANTHEDDEENLSSAEDIGADDILLPASSTATPSQRLRRTKTKSRPSANLTWRDWANATRIQVFLLLVGQLYMWYHHFQPVQHERQRKSRPFSVLGPPVVDAKK